MKRVVLALSILLLWALSVQAQDNLLTNPGFEPPFTEIQGNPTREVANGWQPWHVPASAGAPSFQNRQPEYAPTAPDEPRIRGGIDAQQVFSFFATHVGGVYQTVSGITPGTTLRFSVYAYVWSTTFEEPEISEEDGDVTVEVGIDPTGGTDGNSANIVWSEPVEQYDAYNEYSIEAQASGSSVTVFVRTSAGVPVKHNNIYLDDASLTVGGTEATDEPTAEVTEELTVIAPTVTPGGPATATIEGPTSTPVTPTATTVPPTATPTVTTTPSPLPATATPVTPTVTTTPSPLPASATPITPTATTVPPSATPITPTVEQSATPDITQTLLALTASAPTATPTIAPPSSTPFPQEITPTSDVPTATSTLSSSDQFPFSFIHTVARNETVAVLAERFGSSVDAIAEANNLDENYLIFVGQELIIPVATLPGTPTITPLPTQIFVTATPIEPVPPLGSNNIYVVMPGDSLTRIARLFNTTVSGLAQLNGIVNPNVIQVGQQLMIPAPVDGGGSGATATPIVQPTAVPTGIEYIVRPGDSLYIISIRFGVPIAVIAQANNIRNTWLIYAGQRLIIP